MDILRGKIILCYVSLSECKNPTAEENIAAFHHLVDIFGFFSKAISKVKGAGGAVSINIGTLDATWNLGRQQIFFDLCQIHP